MGNWYDPYMGLCGIFMVLFFVVSQIRSGQVRSSYTYDCYCCCIITMKRLKAPLTLFASHRMKTTTVYFSFFSVLSPSAVQLRSNAVDI